MCQEASRCGAAHPSWKELRLCACGVVEPWPEGPSVAALEPQRCWGLCSSVCERAWRGFDFPSGKVVEATGKNKIPEDMG